MLYRTYRPSTWDEVVGQEHVVTTLKGALAASRIGHAYLFAGPRGTGKTTVARIWAKAVNCTAKGQKPCGKCGPCQTIDAGTAMDIVEIDAASNRGIDDVRQLKETAGTSPASLAYKVFIVDEVHMLSKDAFNALLKLLEEPPAHALFVLATTEPHKVIPTVLSRVQRFDFRKLTQLQIAGKLASIAKTEKLKTDPAALAVIAAASDGAMRDAEVMLTKLAAHAGGDAITEDSVRSVLGLVPATWYAQLAEAISAGNRSASLRFSHELASQGVDMDHFLRGLLEYLRLVLMEKIDPAILASARLALADGHRDRIRQLASTMDGKLLVRMVQSFTRARTLLKTAPVASLPLELAIIELTEPVS